MVPISKVNTHSLKTQFKYKRLTVHNLKNVGSTSSSPKEMVADITAQLKYTMKRHRLNANNPHCFTLLVRSFASSMFQNV